MSAHESFEQLCALAVTGDLEPGISAARRTSVRVHPLPSLLPGFPCDYGPRFPGSRATPRARLVTASVRHEEALRRASRQRRYPDRKVEPAAVRNVANRGGGNSLHGRGDGAGVLACWPD